MEITDVEVLTYHFPRDEYEFRGHDPGELPTWYREHEYGGQSSLSEGRTVEARQECIVKLHTDVGITGIGSSETGHEDANVVATIVRRSLAPFLLGEDPRNIVHIKEKLLDVTSSFISGPRGIGYGAIGGINAACWDILGKDVEKPVYELLGGTADSPIIPYIGNNTLGYRELDDLDSLVKEAKFYSDQGYEAIKLRGGLPGDDDIKTVQAIRNEFSPEELTVTIDVNGGYDKPQARRMAKKLEEYDIYWIEDPFETRDYTEYARLQEQVDINILIGAGPRASELVSMFKSGGATSMVTVGEHTGGISEACRVASLVDLWDLQAISNSHTPLSSVQHWHAWKAFPRKITEGSYVEYNPSNAAWEKLLTDPPRFEDGELVLSDKPGLGTDINEQFIADYPVPEEPNPNVL